jgi:hypothetical protein
MKAKKVRIGINGSVFTALLELYFKNNVYLPRLVALPYPACIVRLCWDKASLGVHLAATTSKNPTDAVMQSLSRTMLEKRGQQGKFFRRPKSASFLFGCSDLLCFL